MVSSPYTRRDASYTSARYASASFSGHDPFAPHLMPTRPSPRTHIVNKQWFVGASNSLSVTSSSTRSTSSLSRSSFTHGQRGRKTSGSGTYLIHCHEIDMSIDTLKTVVVGQNQYAGKLSLIEIEALEDY